MWVKVVKPFGSLLEGEVIELKGSDHHLALITDGLVEEVEAPKVEEAKPISIGAYSISGVLAEPTTTSKTVDNVVDPKLLASFDELKKLSDELKQKEDGFLSIKADFDAEKLAFDTEKADFEKAKAKFESTSTTIIDEPAKAKPGPKKKEETK